MLFIFHSSIWLASNAVRLKKLKLRKQRLIKGFRGRVNWLKRRISRSQTRRVFSKFLVRLNRRLATLKKRGMSLNFCPRAKHSVWEIYLTLKKLASFKSIRTTTKLKKLLTVATWGSVSKRGSKVSRRPGLLPMRTCALFTLKNRSMIWRRSTQPKLSRLRIPYMQAPLSFTVSWCRLTTWTTSSPKLMSTLQRHSRYWTITGAHSTHFMWAFTQ